MNTKEIFIPKGTPLTVEVEHMKFKNKFPSISKELQDIIQGIEVNVSDLLSHLSGIDGVTHSWAYFEWVNQQPDFENLQYTWVTFFEMGQDVVVELKQNV